MSLMLLAFVAQGFLVQTHIHLAPASGAPLAGQTQAGGERHDRLPGDPANCPICQDYLHHGQFVAPAAQALLPPALAISTIALVDGALPFLAARSHDWRGRGPPRL